MATSEEIVNKAVVDTGLDIEDRLERGTHKLAKEIKGIGIDNFGWIKT